MSETLVLKSELETASDIDLLDVCLSSGDFADLAKVIQGNGYRGTRKFRTFSDSVRAFNTSISKGSSVDVVVLNDDFIFDKNFDYGAISQGTTYNKDNTEIVVTTETAKAISEYCQYNPTTATANTLIADANAKGFEVKTIANGTTYTLLPSLSFDGSHYIDSGIVPSKNVDIDFYENTTSGNVVICGYRNSGTYSDGDQFYININNVIRGIYAFIQASASRSDFGIGRKIITSDYTNTIVKVNGNTISGEFTKPITQGYTFVIGGFNVIGRISNCSVTNCYSVNVDGNIFIPVNNGTTDGLLNLTTLEFKPLTAV